MTRLAFLLTGSVQVAGELVHDAFEQVVRRWDDIGYPPACLPPRGRQRSTLLGAAQAAN